MKRLTTQLKKPLILCDRLIKHFSNLNDIVFIPFAGSGSECVSAKNNERNYIGAEINPKYIEIANKRLADIFAMTETSS